MTVTSFLTDVSSEMVINILPLYLANVLGIKTPVIGLIEGIAEATASLLKILSGWLSDRIGRRKWLTVAGYGLSTLSKPFLCFANTWGWILAVRFTDRVGKGIRTSPRDALLADSLGKRSRGLGFGLHRAGDTAGAMLGLIIALVIVWQTQAVGLTLSRNTFQTVVLISIVPAVLAVLVLALGVRESQADKNEGKDTPQPNFTIRELDSRFKWFLVSVIVFTLGNSSNAFLVLRAQERGISVLGVLGMLITFNLIYALISLPAGSLSDRVGRRWLVIGGWASYALIYLGFALVDASWQVWALYAVYGIYYGMTEGVMRAFVADLLPSHQRGTAYGVFNAAVGLTSLPASFIAGLLWQGIGPWAGFGPRAPFIFGALMATFALTLLFTHLPDSHSVND